MPDSTTSTNKNQTTKNPESDKVKLDKADKIKAGLFFTLVTTIGLLSGFGYSFSSTKKRETKNIGKQKLHNYYNLHDSGVELARRALLRATLYSVTGFSLFCLTVWKLSGASNFEEFRLKIGSLLPNIKRNPDQQSGRTEFKNLTELFQYIIDEDQKKKTRDSNDNNIKKENK